MCEGELLGSGSPFGDPSSLIHTWCPLRHTYLKTPSTKNLLLLSCLVCLGYSYFMTGLSFAVPLLLCDNKCLFELKIALTK